MCVHVLQQESLQKALVTAREDNNRLARSLKQALSTSASLHRKLDKTREQYQATIILRYSTRKLYTWGMKV